MLLGPRSQTDSASQSKKTLANCWQLSFCGSADGSRDLDGVKAAALAFFSSARSHEDVLH